MTQDNSKIEQLQDAIENDKITRELKDYISRLQDKLKKVRRLGGNFGRIDFSPYMQDLTSELNRVQEPGASIIEHRGRSKREKSPKQPI